MTQFLSMFQLSVYAQAVNSPHATSWYCISSRHASSDGHQLIYQGLFKDFKDLSEIQGFQGFFQGCGHPVDTGAIFKIPKAMERVRLPLWISLMKIFIFVCYPSLGCDRMCKIWSWRETNLVQITRHGLEKPGTRRVKMKYRRSWSIHK